MFYCHALGNSQQIVHLLVNKHMFDYSKLVLAGATVLPAGPTVLPTSKIYTLFAFYIIYFIITVTFFKVWKHTVVFPMATTISSGTI